MTDTTHDYVAEVDYWDRRVRKLIAAVILNGQLSDNLRSTLLLTIAGADAEWIAADFGVTKNRAQQWRLRGLRKTAEMLGIGVDVDFSGIFDQEARL